MAEYIERYDALNAIERSYWTEGAYERVERLPAADVVEVVHGRWVYKNTCGPNTGMYHCSVCDRVPKSNSMEFYCPNCGSRMDGKD